MRNAKLPDWEQVLSAAARLQRILPEAVLVGGTASAIYAQHRFSRDADHVLTDLKARFDEVAPELAEYKNLDPKWHDWLQVKAACIHISLMLFDSLP